MKHVMQKGAALIAGLILAGSLSACHPQAPSPGSVPVEPTSPSATTGTTVAIVDTPETALQALLDSLRDGDATRYWSLFSDSYRFTPGEQKDAAFAPQAVSDVSIGRLEGTGEEPDRAFRTLAFTVTHGDFPPPQTSADSSGRAAYFYYVELKRDDDGWKIASLALTP